MEKKALIFGSVLGLLLVVSISCSKELETKQVAEVTLSELSAQYDYQNTTSEIGQLGRVLFYDKSMSANNAIGCGDCHKQSIAFSDNSQFSHGFEHKKTTRNTPPIQNLGISPNIFFDVNTTFETQANLFWDGREKDLKNMVLRPVFNHVEMGLVSAADLVEKIKSRPYYLSLFIDAFGDEEIDLDRIATALSAFTGSISANNSRFDQRLTNFNSNQFTNLEKDGEQLFNGKYDCGSCHNLNMPSGYNIFEDSTLRNIGLDLSYTDNGVGDLTKSDLDNGKFKIPNLRNVELTGPYMHDGRFGNLEDVIDHYSSGIKNHPNLDRRLKDVNGNAVRLNITANDKKAIVAFLETLTDHAMITDPKYSNPFITK